MREIKILGKNRNNEEVEMTFRETESGCNTAYGINKAIHLDIYNRVTKETITNYKSFDMRYSYGDWNCNLEYFAFWYITCNWHGYEVLLRKE